MTVHNMKLQYKKLFVLEFKYKQGAVRDGRLRPWYLYEAMSTKHPTDAATWQLDEMCRL